MVTALLWQSVCLVPLGSEVRWDTANSNSSAWNTRGRLPVSRVATPHGFHLRQDFVPIFQLRWMTQQKESRVWEEIGSNLHLLMEKLPKLKWNLHALPELGNAALAGTASLILCKDPACLISTTPPPPSQRGCLYHCGSSAVLWASGSVTVLLETANDVNTAPNKQSLMKQ